jgi:hypothetical protein
MKPWRSFTEHQRALIDNPAYSLSVYELQIPIQHIRNAFVSVELHVIVITYCGCPLPRLFCPGLFLGSASPHGLLLYYITI